MNRSTVILAAIASSLLLAQSVQAEKPEWVKGKQTQRQELREANREDLRERITSKLNSIKSRLQTRVALIRATLSAKTDSQLTVSKDGKTYTVLTGTFGKCSTKFRRRFWGSSELSEMSIGDLLNVHGRWKDEERTMIEGCIVRDISIQKRHGVFVGEVLSMSGSGWVMKPVGSKRPNQTVTVAAGTVYKDRMNKQIAFADIKVGHRVRVKGMWNRSQNTVTEVVHVKDYSLPPKVTGTVTPASSPSPTFTPTPTPTSTPTPTNTPTPTFTPTPTQTSTPTPTPTPT